MKPIIAFYDVHQEDRDRYSIGLETTFELIFCESALDDDTLSLARNATIISVHSTSRVTAEYMRSMPKLALVACRTTGFDHVDLEYAHKHDIKVVNVPAYGQETVAEYTFLMMLAVSRKLMMAAHSVHAGLITPEKLTGRELDAKTLGVIGTGRIGQHVAKIAHGFGMQVIAFDPMPNSEAAKNIGFSYVDLPVLLSQSDFLTLHAPATDANHHLLGSEQFDLMKPGVIIVNTARGSLLDTAALLTALSSGKVGGAGLDVLEGEEYLNLPEELHLLGKATLGDEARQALGIEMLHKLPNVLITSHNAYNSIEALERIRQITVDNIMAWNQQKVQNTV